MKTHIHDFLVVQVFDGCLRLIPCRKGDEPTALAGIGRAIHEDRNLCDLHISLS